MEDVNQLFLEKGAGLPWAQLALLLLPASCASLFSLHEITGQESRFLT